MAESTQNHTQVDVNRNCEHKMYHRTMKDELRKAGYAET